MRNVELDWISPRALTASIDGRLVELAGFERFEDGINFSISREYTRAWLDGEAVDPVEKEAILRDVVAAARKRGWNFVIE